MICFIEHVYQSFLHLSIRLSLVKLCGNSSPWLQPGNSLPHWLRANKLVSLPAAIGDLPNLEKLDARWNKLSSLPEWFQRLEQRGCTVYIEQQETGTSSHDRVFSCMGERKQMVSNLCNQFTLSSRNSIIQ